MAHTKPPFACSRLVAIASIMWRSAHMTVVALEVSVHIHQKQLAHLPPPPNTSHDNT